MKESGKRMVSRVHPFYLSGAYERPTILIILPLLTVPISQSWTDAYRRPSSANDAPTNWCYLLSQKPDKGVHETVMYWFLGSDSEQREPLSDTIETRVLP